MTAGDTSPVGASKDTAPLGGSKDTAPRASNGTGPVGAGNGKAGLAAPAWPRLVGDIGGTNARFGWIDGPASQMGGACQISHLRTLAVADHAGPGAAVQAYLQWLRSELGLAAPPAPQHAALAVATAVTGDDIELTNAHWRFSSCALRATLGLQSLAVLNDFEALALSLPLLGPTQMRLHGAAPCRSQTMAVIGPGTGLGVAAVLPTRRGWQALPGEGGHATLSAADDFESALLAHVRRSHAHVSAERLLSGIGLPLLHQAVAAVRGETAAPLSAQEIVERGLAEPGDAQCARTLDAFCALLGSFAGNVALSFGARGGVFIGGGIVPRLGDRFFASGFRQRFEAKGRFQAYLQAIPTAVITDTLAALSGAALAIEQGLG